MKRGKNYRSALDKIEKEKKYSIEEALKIISGTKLAKFDESVEVHVKLMIDPKSGEEQARGSVVLPHGTGKTKKVAVITSKKAKEAKDAGADVVGAEDLITKLKSGKFDGIDVIIATPEMMPKIAPIARVLGPKGLMPSPKNDTVTDKVKEAVEAMKKGKVNFKNDSQGNIHQVIGKVSFGEDKLNENLKEFMEAVKKSKQEAVKGRYIGSVSVCSTMGPGIRVDI